MGLERKIYIKKKKGLSYPPHVHRNRPINHIRIVMAGISGSSMLDTEALTSGYGLSSSSIASRSSSILRGEKENGFSDVVDMKGEERKKGRGGVKKDAEGAVKTLTSFFFGLRASSQEA